MSLLQIHPLTETEQDQIVELFSTPLVQKYLTFLGTSIISNILGGFPGDGQSDSEYIRKEAHYKGQLAVLDTLLSIQPRQ